MRLVIAAIGRLKDTGEAELVARYQKRIATAGRAHALGPLTITEHSESRAADAGQRKAEEAVWLAAAVARADRRVILDEGGQAMPSVAFAAFVRETRDTGTREMAFLIGGPDGHDAALRSRADLVLSLSAMTMPHGLARVLLTEQLYRAVTIISGHPYHRV
jgi:23S rRNA (pseudouridine1915-N3)-methyltransferase